MKKWLAVLLGLALLAAFLTYRYEQANRERDAQRVERMRSALATMRSAIARFHSEQGRRPQSFDDLVPAYLPEIPVDPVTRSAATWRVTTEETVTQSEDFSASTTPQSDVVIVNVHSGAPGADPNGRAWADY